MPEEADDFSGLTASEIVVFVKNRAIEVLTDELALSVHVDIAPIASGRIHDGAMRVRIILQRVDEGHERRGIVAVIDDDCATANLQHVEAAGARFEVRGE